MIRVGIAGWDYPDWEGVVYPPGPGREFDALAFLTRYFDTIEINVTFYRQIDPAMAQAWAGRVAGAGPFLFTAKLHRSLTHPAPDPGSREVPGGESPGALSAVEAEAARCRTGLAPLMDAGLLGALLMQFPHSFHDTRANWERLDALATALAGLPLVAEFRHRSWDNQKTLDRLRERGIGFCNIDQPSIGATLPATCHVTSRIAYVRLHGRNGANWFRRGAASASRYDYLYSMEELEPWVQRVRRLAGHAEEVFVIANNHYHGKGPANALMLSSALSGRRPRAPATLVAAHPVLSGMVEEDPGPPVQRSLF